jgi:hypothetical protein
MPMWRLNGGSMAGESAGREHERIRDARRERLRNQRELVIAAGVLMVVAGAVMMHLLLDAWWLGALLGAVMIASRLAPAQREVAWRKGAEGEAAVGRALDALAPAAVALHDRRIPRSRANVDHILVAPTGVWTIDAKNYTGKLETRGRGRELWIDGRNRSKVLDQARGQAEVVRTVLADAGIGSVPVRPALCFVGVKWPLLFRPRAAGDVGLVPLRGIRMLTEGQAVLSAAQIARVRAALDGTLSPAAPASGAPPAPRPPAPAVRRTGPTAAPPPAITVNPWNRYGKRRLYVNGSDGTTLGYVDLDTNAVAPVEEHYRQTILDAVAAYLRQG